MKATCAKIYTTLNNILPGIGDISNNPIKPYSRLNHLLLGVREINSPGPHPVFIITHYTKCEGGIGNKYGGIMGNSNIFCIDAENKTALSVPQLSRSTSGNYKIDSKPHTKKEQREHNMSSLAWLEGLSTSNCQ